MQCPMCKQELRISKTRYDVKDGDPYVFQDLVCINPQCVNYAGKNLNNPAKIAQTVEHNLRQTP